MSSKHLSPGQFPELPYPRLREAYARATVHQLGETQAALNEAMKTTNLPFETLKQMAKSDNIPHSDAAFDLLNKHPSVAYDMAHRGAAMNTIHYMLNPDPVSREQAKEELLSGFRNRHIAIKSPYFSAMVN